MKGVSKKVKTRLRNIHRMKSIFKIIVSVLLLSFYSHLALSAEINDKKKDFYEKVIKLEPNNEDNRFRYAFELYSLKQFDKAEEQNNHLLKINPENKDGKLLQAELEEIKKLSQPADIDKRVADYSFNVLNTSLRDLNSEIKDTEEGLKKLDSLNNNSLPKAKESLSQNLKEKYDICSYKSAYARGSDEYKESLLISNYVIKGLSEDAEKLYRELITKFPDSPDARLDYANFLINQKRITDAEKITLQLKEFYPSNPLLLFNLDQINLLKTKKDLDLENALNDYRLNFAQFSLAKLQCIIDK